MKCIFQLISHVDGQRSEPFYLDRAEFARLLDSFMNTSEGFHISDADLVLVVGDVDVGGESVRVNFSVCPMMRVDTFIERFGGNHA